MQITIDTNDILGDETTIRDEVIRQVVAALSLSMRNEMKEKIRAEIDASFKQIIRELVTELANAHLDTEFTVTNEFGRESTTSTVRNRIADFIQRECTFKKESYSSGNTAFTNMALTVISAEVAKFKSEFNSIITKKVMEECLDEATKKLKASVGIKV